MTRRTRLIGLPLRSLLRKFHLSSQIERYKREFNRSPVNLTDKQYREGKYGGTIFSRQFFFAVGKPHRPMDAKLTGEALAL